ncbi:hypothetical protein BU15DRAFT_89790 [Melanogaster broomeanus]|nr:hypothetical protein BU15DRAFT_89790 [Melanogaster broomeanus]
MGKNKKRNNNVPDEKHLALPAHPEAAATPIIDTHTHLLTTFSAYKSKYPAGKYDTVWDFVRGTYDARNVKAIVDVWCEAPVQQAWKELADSALTPEDRAEKWGGIEYWFVMASLYTDTVEKSILDAMAHPRCVGWGEMGLDYHYDNSPREIQQQVFTKQLRQARSRGDTERILKQEVPVDHRIHIHCFTDSPEFAQRLLDHFPNLHVGITGVISYSTNLNTSALVRQMVASPGGPRILLETDAPFMVPSNIYASLPEVKGRLPLCHTGMIPWVADFTAGVIGDGWGTVNIMERANQNAQSVYGI